MTDERVGARDYMPQRGDLGGRLEDVHPNFDVYMLGELLCQQASIAQWIYLAALVLGTSIPAMQECMEHFDALRSGIGLGSIAPMAGGRSFSGLLLWFVPLGLTGLDAGLLQQAWDFSLRAWHKQMVQSLSLKNRLVS